MPVSEQLIYEIDNGVATIRLNRPEKMNAFTDQMLDEWLSALDDCATNRDVRVVVITGTGRAFTTGGDIGSFADKATQTPAEIKARVAEGIQKIPMKITSMDKPVIAALNGFATGGGLDIALACDIRFAAEGARFAETYARMGLIPGAGGAYFLPRIVGTAKALEMFFGAEFISARDAEQLGLVNKTFPDEELMPGTYEFARRVADSPPLSIQLIKRIVRQSLELNLAGALELVAANLPVVRTSADHREAIAAFKEKRQPVYEGK